MSIIYLGYSTYTKGLLINEKEISESYYLQIYYFRFEVFVLNI